MRYSILFFLSFLFTTTSLCAASDTLELVYTDKSGNYQSVIVQREVGDGYVHIKLIFDVDGKDMSLSDRVYEYKVMGITTIKATQEFYAVFPGYSIEISAARKLPSNEQTNFSFTQYGMDMKKHIKAKQFQTMSAVFRQVIEALKPMVVENCSGCVTVKESCDGCDSCFSHAGMGHQIPGAKKQLSGDGVPKHLRNKELFVVTDGQYTKFNKYFQVLGGMSPEVMLKKNRF